jgi:MFS family permease
MDAGMAIGSFVIGIVSSSAGYRSIYMIGVVLIVVTGILYSALIQKMMALSEKSGADVLNNNEI